MPFIDAIQYLLSIHRHRHLSPFIDIDDIHRLAWHAWPSSTPLSSPSADVIIGQGQVIEDHIDNININNDQSIRPSSVNSQLATRSVIWHQHRQWPSGYVIGRSSSTATIRSGRQHHVNRPSTNWRQSTTVVNVDNVKSTVGQLNQRSQHVSRQQSATSNSIDVR